MKFQQDLKDSPTAYLSAIAASLTTLSEKDNVRFPGKGLLVRGDSKLNENILLELALGYKFEHELPVRSSTWTTITDILEISQSALEPPNWLMSLFKSENANERLAEAMPNRDYVRACSSYPAIMGHLTNKELSADERIKFCQNCVAVLELTAESSGDNVGWVERGITNAFIHLGKLIADAVAFFLLFIRQIYIIFLQLIGPLAFAIAIFPGFGGNIVHWLAKYVSILFWLTIYIILSSMMDLMTIMFDNSGQSWMTLLTVLASIFCVFSIPTMGTWLIQGGESGQGMKNPFTAGMAMVGASAGKTLGGGIRGAMQSHSAGGSALGGALTGMAKGLVGMDTSLKGSVGKRGTK